MIERCAAEGCTRRAVGRPVVYLWTNKARDHEPAKFHLDDLGLCSPCTMEGKVHKVLERQAVRAEIEALMAKGGRAKPCWESLQVKFHAIQNNDAPEFTKRNEGPVV